MQNSKIAFLLIGILLLPGMASAQATLTGDTVTIEKAQVLSINKEATSTVAGTDAQTQTQNITAKVLSGTQKGTAISFDNDFTQLSVGDVFYIRHTTNSLDGT